MNKQSQYIFVLAFVTFPPNLFLFLYNFVIFLYNIQ